MPYTMDAPKKKPTPPPIRKKPVSPFQKSKGPTTIYERALRGVARECGKLITGYLSADPLDPTTEASLSQALNSYSSLIGPWCLHLVNNIIRAVDNQDKFAWRQHSQNMSVALRKELENAPIGPVFAEIMKQNVLLIKSIPLQAAQRVHKLVQENMMQSARSSEIAKKIMETESVTRSRATLIARTEISKASTALTRSRASHVGSEGYLWRTAGDLIVRTSHRKMSNKFVKWEEPPTLDKMTGHAGEFPNCRCYCEPVIPEI